MRIDDAPLKVQAKWSQTKGLTDAVWIVPNQTTDPATGLPTDNPDRYPLRMLPRRADIRVTSALRLPVHTRRFQYATADLPIEPATSHRLEVAGREYEVRHVTGEFGLSEVYVA